MTKKALPNLADPHRGDSSSSMLPDQSADAPLADSCFPIVGIGVSAGALALLQKLVKAEIMEVSIISNALVNE